MSPKIFITGATGYIGGDLLATLVEAHGDWEITALVRNSDKGAKIAAVYPKVRLVYGDLDSVELLEEESSKADIVYHTANCDHQVSARAITKGLGSKTSPAFLIHTSGTGILTYETVRAKAFGEELPKVFNDWEGINELTSLPDDAFHRPVDKIVLEASVVYPNVKTAIVCPPAIFGAGRGPDNTRSIQLYELAKFSLKNGKTIQIGEGKSIWTEIHVHDLSNLFLLLGEAAAAGGAPATWNDQGYYFAENGEFAWGSLSKAVAQEAVKRKLLETEEIVNLSETDAVKMSPYLAILIGTSSRGTGIRARKLLGWKPQQHKISEEVANAVESEARALGLVKSHAEKVEE